MDVELPTKTLLLKPVEAARQLQISRAQAYRLIESGELPSIKVGNQLRVPLSSLQDWIQHRLANR